jgi:hypothetical protein
MAPGGCIAGCIACRGERRGGRAARIHERDIVQIQKEVWKRIAQEEREGKRRPPIVRWAS